MSTITNYNQQAIDFLSATQTEFCCVYLKTGRHFEDDKEDRDIYKITLKRGNRTFAFDFGQSIVASGEYKLLDHLLIEKLGKRFISKKEYEKLSFYDKRDTSKNNKFSIPSAYDVLACLTKSDPGSFEEFCAEFGYSTDSKKAEKTYKAVLNEWDNINKLYSDSEIEVLQEIN